MNTYKKLLLAKLLVLLVISFSLPSSHIDVYYLAEKSSIYQFYDSAVKSGEMLRKEGRFDLSIDDYRRALEIARKMSFKKKEIKCLKTLGLLYWNTGEYKKSAETYAQAFSLARELGLDKEQEECQAALEIYRLYTEGKKLFSSREYLKSIEIFQRTIDLARKIRSKEHELNCLRQQSLSYYYIGELQLYHSLNKDVLTIAQSLNYRKAETTALYNIGLYYQRKDNYSKALNYYERAIKTAQSIHFREIESDSFNNIGNVYGRLGDHDKALDCYMKCLAIDKKLGREVQVELNNIGMTYRRKFFYSEDKEFLLKAIDYLEESLELSRKLGDINNEFYVLNNLGMIFIDLKKYSNALEYFSAGFNKAKNIKYSAMDGMTLTNMGLACFNLGDYEKSIKYYKEAIDIALEVDGRHVLWEAYFGLGRTYERIKEFSQSIMCYKKSIDIIDHIRSRIILDTQKASYGRNKIQVYESLVNLLSRLDIGESSKEHDREIFYIVERAKARAFLENLGESRIDISERLNPELKKIENEISNRISSIILDLSRMDLTEERRKQLLMKLQKEEDGYIRLLSRIRDENPDIASLISLQPSRAEKIQKLLNEKSALIEYFLGDKQSVMFFVTKKEFNVYQLPSRVEIEKSLKAYLKVLSTSPKEKFWGVLAAKRIYRELLFPLGRTYAYIDDLIIVPDGVLYYLPFETLIPDTSTSFSGKDYLIKKYKISYTPSSSALMYLSKNSNDYERKKGLLAFGNPSYALKSSSKIKQKKTYVDTLREMYLENGFEFSPLPYSEKEIAEISKYFPKEKKDIYLEDEAKEETFKKVSLKDYQIVHFACHGFLAEEFPFRSALVLSMDEDPKEDGFLQVRELYNYRMNANLIVLSACQTGRGKLVKGEGILGLPRVFFYSGVNSVLLALWKINDKSTSKFMDYFYQYLSLGNDKAQALQLAKLRMINSKFSHPFYWAAFVLNGDYNSALGF
jgi:CHAT domain-containing protein/Tfp pilus assembly protein PilF